MVERGDTPSSDDQLMERIAGGDQEALSALIARWQSRIFTFTQRMVSSAEAAEELTQETFWQLWRARERYQPAGRFAAWLFQIASRLSVQYWRQQRARPVAREPVPESHPAPPRDAPDVQAREAEMQRALAEALERLPEKQRVALELSRLEGLSQAEVAAVLDCSEGAVEQLLYRGRQALRAHLAPWLEATPKNIQKDP